jgi:hypothetical protein
MTDAPMGSRQAKKSCCLAHKTKHSDKKNKGCCGNCNPFMVCCNFFALTSQQQRIVTPFVYVDRNFHASSEANHSNFLSEVWNPPKVA